MVFLSQIKYRDLLLELVKIIGFGTLSLLLSRVQFNVPEAVSGISDLREPALIISVFYFRHWISIALVVAITSFGIPPEASYGATFAMHFVGMLGVFLFYKYVNYRINKRSALIAIWFLIGFGYFYVLILPVMALSHVILGKVEVADVFSKFIELAYEIKFEMLLTSIVLVVYSLYLKSTEQLEQQNSNLFLSMRKAEESERLKTAFLQNLSHEIRTPMNGIQGFSRLLIKNYESPEQTKNYCQHILQCGDHLLNIVNDIIDISQLETEQLEITYSINTVSGLFSDVMSTIEASGNYKIDRVELVCIKCEKQSIWSDLYKIERILYHIIENALKFSKSQAVKVNCKIEGKNLMVSVSDKGIGILAEHKDLIFNKFQQVERNLTRAYGGNGLGLSIVNGFVETLGGSVNYESEIDKGTTFFIEIPVERV